MPANSRAIQSEAILSTVTDALPIDDRMGERKTRGQSSGCSFALHKAIAVASRMDKSLSFSLSKITSRRFRMALLVSAFSGNMYGSMHIEYCCDICQKTEAWMFPFQFDCLEMLLHEKF